MIQEINNPVNKVNTDPVDLIKIFLPEINIIKEENQGNSRNFKNILLKIYYICALLNTNNKKYNAYSNRDQYNIDSTILEEIKNHESKMTEEIKAVNKEKHKDDNLNNLIQFLGGTYCYIRVNNDLHQYTYGRKKFNNNNNIKFNKNQKIYIPKHDALDADCVFSILETIQQKDQMPVIKTKIEEWKNKKSPNPLLTNGDILPKHNIDINKEAL